MRNFCFLAFLIALLAEENLAGQGAQFRGVDLTNTHERMVAIVPIVGAGTRENPKRPLFSELPGIVGYKMELADDGRFALVEFVAKDRKIFDAIRVSREPGLRFAAKDDTAQKDGVLQYFQQLKRNFRAEEFRGLPVK